MKSCSFFRLRKASFLGFVACLFFLVGCDSFWGNGVWIEAPLEDDALHGRMIRIKASQVKNYEGGAVAYLGSYNANAKYNEKPQMRVALNYDFSLDRHEVTCADFRAVMGTTFDKRCEEENSDMLPVSMVTFYDAVLYANEKSKREGLDTAYTYNKATFDKSGNCIYLEGWVFNPDKDAYRLPTEAEWLLAAGREWRPESEWNSETSGFKARPVCSYAEKRNEFCDMAGNLKEWVGDWLGYFKDTLITNYIGDPDGGVSGERVIKGGCFRNAASSIRKYLRGDVYQVTSASKSDYLGFRLAFGRIPNAIWMGRDGMARDNRVIPLASANTMRNFENTYKVKLVFRNDVTQNLALIDYVNGTLTVTSFKDTLNVYHPDISPNGKFVVYCTGLEGTSGKSQVYVRPLTNPKTYPVRLNFENAAIPRWRLLENGDTAIVFVSDAGSNRDASEFAKKSTWQTVFSKGRFSKPQKLFDGAYHGGVSDDGRLAVTGANRLRARVVDASGVHDTLWYNGEQACNVSLAKDGSKRILFLDFGGKTGEEFVGESYGVHKRLLIADSTGKLIQSVVAPEGFSFDHAEWAVNAERNESGKGGLVVATLANVNEAHQKIVLVDLADSSVTEIAEGDELWHPCLWKNDVYESDELDSDSAGVYLYAGDSWEMVIMRFKMELLWRYYDSTNVAIVGSSRPMFALSPKKLDKRFFAVNFAQTPNSMYFTRDFMERYVFNHYKKLKYLVISLDIDFWSKVDGPEGDNLFYEDYRRYPGYVYDENHDYWKDGVPDALLNYTVNGIGSSDEADYLSDRGSYTKSGCGSWGENPVIEADSTLYDDKPYLIENSFDVLKSLVKQAADRDIKVVGIIFPQSPAYKETGAFGRYGLRRSEAEKLIKRLENLSKDYPNFVLMDENKMGDHDYDDDKAVDEDHLCYGGQLQITERLNQLLLSLDR